MNKRCKTCKQKVAANHGHCPTCFNNMSPEARQHIKEVSLRKRGYQLDQDLNKWSK